jgi:hypothetical protein
VGTGRGTGRIVGREACRSRSCEGRRQAIISDPQRKEIGHEKNLRNIMGVGTLGALMAFAAPGIANVFDEWDSGDELGITEDEWDGPLRRRMIADMAVRGFALATQRGQSSRFSGQ